MMCYALHMHSVYADPTAISQLKGEWIHVARKVKHTEQITYMIEQQHLHVYVPPTIKQWIICEPVS